MLENASIEHIQTEASGLSDQPGRGIHMSIVTITPRVRVDGVTNDFKYEWTDIPEGMSCSSYRRARARARVGFWKKLFKV
jgi:hypothetical protein